MARQLHRDPDCSVFVGNLDQRVTEELLWELLLQAGPVRGVHIPCDKESGKQKAFGFVKFFSSASAHYAWELLDGIKLFDRAITVRPKQKEGEATSWIPSNQMPANHFYKDFYSKYNELKHRPRSEPRRSRWEEENYHHRNNSFSHPLNRSLSSPGQMPNSPQWPQMHYGPTPPSMNWMFMGPNLGNPMFNQTPLSRSRYH